MFRYVVKRLVLLLVTLFGITLITFLLTRLTPGDPAAMKLQGSGGGMSSAVGGYDDLVERNRRNLGLDKPMILNFHFEDREYEADRALDDYLRSGELWRKDGERRLLRVTTIALKPALDRYAALKDGVPTRSKVKLMEPVDRQKELLVSILPRLASDGSTVVPRDLNSDQQFMFWSEWYTANSERYSDANIRKVVSSYLAASDETRASVLQVDVLKVGGFAVPLLVDALSSSADQVVLRANRGLQAQIGFTFLVDERKFAESKGEITRRWRSWWRRESISYSKFSRGENLLNVFGNSQFGLWMRQALLFDFGDSYSKHRSVISMIGEALPILVLISGLSIFFSYLIAIPIGIFSAAKRHTVSDKVITLILFVLYSLPGFWVASIFLLTLTGPPYLNWFPSRGISSEGIQLGAAGVTTARWVLDRAWHVALPVTVLSYGSLAFISRQMRSAMLETLNLDFIRTAQAKGLSWRVVLFKHALRNSLIPIITISAGILPEMIAGAIITESIFTIPGMGILTLDAIVNRDYPVINAVLFFSALLTLVGILITDLCYAIVDPRITYA